MNGEVVQEKKQLSDYWSLEHKPEIPYKRGQAWLTNQFGLANSIVTFFIIMVHVWQSNTHNRGGG